MGCGTARGRFGMPASSEGDATDARRMFRKMQESGNNLDKISACCGLCREVSCGIMGTSMCISDIFLFDVEVGVCLGLSGGCVLTCDAMICSVFGILIHVQKQEKYLVFKN